MPSYITFYGIEVLITEKQSDKRKSEAQHLEVWLNQILLLPLDGKQGSVESSLTG